MKTIHITLLIATLLPFSAIAYAQEGSRTGREAADIRYWLTDEQGKKVFEHKDTIRAEFWGNAYAGSVGQLAHPFASKIASRLTEAKLF